MSTTDLTITQAILQILDHKGPEVIKQPGLFCAMLDDIAPHLSRERRIIRRIMCDDICNGLWDAYTADSKSRVNILNKLVYSLQYDYGVSDDWTDLFLNFFSDAFGWNKSVTNEIEKISDDTETCLEEAPDLPALPDVSEQEAQSPISAAEKEFQKYLEAARRGDAKAQFVVAECYENGNGVGVDIPAAIGWYTIADNQGVKEAPTKLFWIYINLGEEEKALSILKDAVDKENWHAMIVYANLFKDGVLVKQNMLTYAQWMSKVKKIQKKEINEEITQRRMLRAKQQAADLRREVSDMLNQK